MAKAEKVRVARGHWQEALWEEMKRGEAVEPFKGLVGRARHYAGNYEESFFNMIDRAKAAGYAVQSKPGERGGMWGSSYWLETL